MKILTDKQKIELWQRESESAKRPSQREKANRELKKLLKSLPPEFSQNQNTNERNNEK